MERVGNIRWECPPWSFSGCLLTPLWWTLTSVHAVAAFGLVFTDSWCCLSLDHYSHLTDTQQFTLKWAVNWDSGQVGILNTGMYSHMTLNFELLCGIISRKPCTCHGHLCFVPLWDFFESIRTEISRSQFWHQNKMGESKYSDLHSEQGMILDTAVVCFWCSFRSLSRIFASSLMRCSPYCYMWCHDDIIHHHSLPLRGSGLYGVVRSVAFLWLSTLSRQGGPMVYNYFQ